MDFYKIRVKPPNRNGIVEIYPDFVITRSEDLMVRGGSFYALWDEAKGLWTTDEFDVQRIVDASLRQARDHYVERHPAVEVVVKYMGSYATGIWVKFQNYLKNMVDNFHLLDSKLTFTNEEIKKTDYASKTLPYSLEEGPYDAWNELIGTLYKESERAKLEWAIGAVVSGEAKNIQKFIVLYGAAGGGKSTVLNIIEKLFSGYTTVFDAKALTTSNNVFATEAFRDNPLVAIQHDGDLSKIQDNTKLNSIVSHEKMTVNEKFKSTYSMRSNAFLFMGTNSVVKISDGKAGLIRRLVDIHTSGQLVTPKRYDVLMSQIEFELGAIAHKCLERYRKMGKLYYNHYRPLTMIAATDYFYNFVEDHYFEFKDSEYVTLARAFDLYKKYAEDSGYEFRLPKPKFRTELMDYFEIFKPVDRVDDDRQVRSVYREFKTNMFVSKEEVSKETIALVLDSDESIFDDVCSNCPAQYASMSGVPTKKWDQVTTTLSDLETKEVHYVRVPKNHIVIDFDIKDEDGNKSLELNLEAAAKWPHTYAEYSKSGKGIHLHYIYDGDAERLSRIYSEGIEVKVSVGHSSLRRKLIKCNTTKISTISGGLPLKEEKVLDVSAVQTEKGLRSIIERNLKKEIHPGTKPSIDFIHKILEDAYSSGLKYDVSQMRPRILNFAINSTNQSEYCVKLVGQMKFMSEDKEEKELSDPDDDSKIAFFDVEVFPNLFVVCWKYKGKENKPVRMINPTSEQIEGLLRMKLIGFNCRRYDNHILYARYLGYSIEDLFDLSYKIVNGSRNAFFREAYNVSFVDIYDFSSKKQSLKAFEIELGVHHQELGIPWDQPVPEEQWEMVAAYCDNDVVATEAVFDARMEDFVARQILSDLSGLPINSTTQSHTAKILFGNDHEPQKKFKYTDLSEEFPGYTFDGGKSLYRGEDPGEGGYVYAEPGMYENVALLDIASMHPTSIEILDLFGPYTKNYVQIKEARLAIKHNDIDKAKEMFDGRLAKYLTSVESADSLSYALKIIINIVYGLTSASFPNKFRDNRNKDNIVAKRGALFMVDLKYAVQEKGYIVAHIKTDSIKIPNADKKIIDFVIGFGEKYGYIFEHEATYSKFCLVNNAVYVAKKDDNSWTATGAEFIHPYVFKSLFSKEEIVFSDMCETKSVTSPSQMYLDMNEDLPDVEMYETELIKRRRMQENPNKNLRLNPELERLSDNELERKIAGGHNYQFIGRVSSFCPIKTGCGGGILYRMKEDKYYAVTGTKGYRWLESDMVKSLNKIEDIDTSYYKKLVDDAADHIAEFGDLEWFLVND